MEFITLYRDLKRARDVMGRSSSGDGIERAIYDLNPALACQSPLVEAYYVLNAYQLLPALNRPGEDTSEAVVLIDNHIAAYIAAHFASHRDAELRDPDNQVDPCLPTLAAVRLLARIQEKAAKVRAYPKLGMLAVKLLEPTVKRFFNRSTREKISSAMRDAGATGRLTELLTVANDQRIVESDARRFQFAVMEYRDLEKNLSQLEVENANRAAISRELGAQVSSVLSGMLSTVALLGIVLVAFLTAA